MKDLFAIVYVSSMTREMTVAEIEYLLSKASERNKQYDITGILLCYDGSFMQYIEGPEAELLKIYDIITADPNHQGIIQLIHTRINAREFSNWSMAYSVASKHQVDQLTQASWPESDNNKSLGRKLLGEFWKANSIMHKF